MFFCVQKQKVRCSYIVIFDLPWFLCCSFCACHHFYANLVITIAPFATFLTFAILQALRYGIREGESIFVVLLHCWCLPSFFCSNILNLVILSLFYYYKVNFNWGVVNIVKEKNFKVLLISYWFWWCKCYWKGGRK